MVEQEPVLVAAARDGDQEAFGRLAEHYRPRLARACRRQLGSADEAEDAVQETLLRAFHALPRLREVERFGPWLYRIAANVCRDHLEARQTLEPLDEAAAISTEATPERALFSRAVHDAVASLPPDIQVVVALHHLEERSFSEIARRLGLPATTVKGRLNRGRSLLREEMLRMGTVTDSGTIELAPPRLALLLAQGVAYGTGGEEASTLGRLLKEEGFAVTDLRPERAMAWLSRSIPQILVVADDVPGADAFAVIRDLRAEHRTRGVAIILLLRPSGADGKVGEEETYRAWQAGVDCLLTLPCNPRELVGFAHRIERQGRAQHCMVVATDLAWRGEATDCLRYLRAAIDLGGEAQRHDARRNVAFRRLARNVEFQELVGDPDPQTTPIRVALVSSPVTCFDKEANLRAMGQVLREHAGPDVDLFVFPERSICGEPPKGSPRDYLQVAEPVPDGPSTRRVIEMARQYRTTVCAGLHEVSEGRCFYTSILCGPDGYVGKQRRMLVNPKLAGMLASGEDVCVHQLFGHRCVILASSDWLFPEPSCLSGLTEAAVIIAPTDTFSASQECWLRDAAVARMLDLGVPILIACGGDDTRCSQDRQVAALVADPTFSRTQVALCQTRALGETKVIHVRVDLQQPRQVWVEARRATLLTEGA